MHQNESVFFKIGDIAYVMNSVLSRIVFFRVAVFIFPVLTLNFVENPRREIISVPSGHNVQLAPAICDYFASKYGALIRTQFRS